MPTLIELSGAANPAGGDPLDGSSLVPLLSAGRGLREGDVIGEYLAEGAVAPVVMIRRGRLKFVSSPGDPDQLFDLESDPNELANLAGSPAHQRELAQFRRDVAERWDLVGLHADILASQRRRRLVANALAVGAETAWDQGPDGNLSKGYVRDADFWMPFKRARLRRGKGKSSN
jgi:choline-sulfatase